ncbi:MAG: endonuclease/exonuclease/phosphatase family metal-dependent hydrolase [Bacteriovoracaceae bacterium]|jgi:endonuclease/exonuclease/phosphatase family metal-dependent hydrolase
MGKSFLLAFIALTTLSACGSLSNVEPIRIVHFNIKELDSTKIKKPGAQLKAVKKILAKHDFNILSLNEVQYDIPGVPTYRFKTRGENLRLLSDFLDKKYSDWNYSFHPANTGAFARKKKNGTYYTNFSSKNSRDYADQVNFGLFPAQYSTGALFDFKKTYEVLVKDLKWKDFNKEVKISRYKQANGKALPKDMELFDKGFSDVTVMIKGKEVHLILLHTVPAYHFGNKKSPNYKRNADQLRFLEWYLTGKTDFPVELEHVKPLPPGTPFIAMGDWNTDITNKKNTGSKILRRLFTKFTPWMSKPETTNESAGFAKKRLKLTLDYIMFSEHFEVVSAGVLKPVEDRVFMGCNNNKAKFKNIPEDRVLTNWYDRKKKRKCYVTVSKDFYEFKQASDHFPIFANLKFK